jgi:Domain of unknown function (DUF3291)
LSEPPAAFELAQLNVGRLLAPVDSDEISGFVAQLAPINALAEASPGFVWRLKTPAGDATAVRAYDDDLMIINLSVWATIEALRAFTYDSAHVNVLRGRRTWFERSIAAHLVLWWVPAGHRPSVEEAVSRLETLRRDGPSAAAFTLKTTFEPS